MHKSRTITLIKLTNRSYTILYIVPFLDHRHTDLLCLIYSEPTVQHPFFCTVHIPDSFAFIGHPHSLRVNVPYNVYGSTVPRLHEAHHHRRGHHHSLPWTCQKCCWGQVKILGEKGGINRVKHRRLSVIGARVRAAPLYYHSSLLLS